MKIQIVDKDDVLVGHKEREEVMNDDEFANSRLCMTEFGGCSTVAKVFKNTIAGVVDKKTVSFLIPKMVKILNAYALSEEGEKGKRKIVISQFKEYMDRLQLNPTVQQRQDHDFYRVRTSIFSQKYYMNLDKNDLRLDLYIPMFDPKLLKRESKGATHLRFRLALFSIV